MGESPLSARALREAGVILAGRLGPVSVPDIFTFLNMIKATTRVVFIAADGLTKTIMVEEGEMVFAASSASEDALQEMLIRHGKITREQAQEAAGRMGEGRRMGKLLVEMGALSPKGLWWGVRTQVMEIIYSLFSWKTGSFAAYEQPEPFEEKIKLNVSAVNVVMEGIRRQDEWPRIRERIPHDRIVLSPALLPEKDGKVRFYDEEERIFRLLDGQRNVREVIHLSALDEFETLRILFSFLTANLAKVASVHGGDDDEGTEDHARLEALARHYNRMFRLLADGMRANLPAEASRSNLDGLLSDLDGADARLLDGCAFDDDGGLPVNLLVANVSELPHARRYGALEEVLNNLLSFMLFEVSKHVKREDKARLYAEVEALRAEAPAGS